MKILLFILTLFIGAIFTLWVLHINGSIKAYDSWQADIIFIVFLFVALIIKIHHLIKQIC